MYEFSETASVCKYIVGVYLCTQSQQSHSSYLCKLQLDISMQALTISYTL